MYCSLAAAYAKTMWLVKQERSTSQSSQVCVLCPHVLPSSFFQGSLARRSPREHKSVLGIEKQFRTIYAELNSNPLMSYHGNGQRNGCGPLSVHDNKHKKQNGCRDDEEGKVLK